MRHIGLEGLKRSKVPGPYICQMYFLPPICLEQMDYFNCFEIFLTSKDDKQGLRYAPFCFTEQGVTMLFCILNSSRAIEVNIQVIRVFSKMREILLSNKDSTPHWVSKAE